MVEVEVRGAGEIHDREDRAKGRLEARDIARLLVRGEELLVALALNLDEVRHLADFVDVAEDLADSPLLRPCPAGGLARCVDRFGGHVLPCAMRDARRWRPAIGLRQMPELFWSAVPAILSNAFGPCANSDPVPERTGKAPGARHRAAEPSISWMRPI